ncbi:2-polyprenyl-6-methoxyphenol hydroxylase-like FAD-dependent oxidoreductase [Natronospira proteinivora]|uniref:2-polyprenyl-6-methoxyphenol hydroxylase-like FAD-dependent oxidoreductase n=1 Tax=Natronospira proteinivora TaxID=1807133 RepID=A0ABT1G7G4_9GAMM|nr:NAD(P)/FAD-dependent oxidoreductase [Natronospira proteinivora]MCP1727249.1 2-polyprenyl-6-methoxyphenol hydroxylase-like FAD-dependent oxidoreductase [Natronospira proteinivora]
MKGRSIAIVGCGTAGLATAIFLARQGHAVTLFERFPEPTAVGAGILLQPTGMAVLRELGLLEAMEETAARVDRLDGRTSSGRRVMDVSYGGLAAQPYALGVHRANLLQVLLGAAVDAGVEIRCDTEVNGIRHVDERPVLELADGKTLAGFDGVVIANGTQSQLREQLAIPQRCQPYPWGALWTISTSLEQAPEPALLQRYVGAGVMIGVMPTGLDPQSGKPCVSFFWSLKTADYAAWKDRPLADWKSQVLEYWPEIGPLMASITDRDQMLLATYADVRMRRWHQGSVAVIGDAAHGMSPQLGQGANLALVDALVLARCVDHATSIPAAFAAYTPARRRHLRFYQLASRALTPLFQSDSRLAGWLRDISFPLTNSVPYTRRQALRTVAGIKTGLLFDRDVLELGQGKGREKSETLPIQTE